MNNGSRKEVIVYRCAKCGWTRCFDAKGNFVEMWSPNYPLDKIPPISRHLDDCFVCQQSGDSASEIEDKAILITTTVSIHAAKAG